MGGLSWTHWVIVAAVAALVLGGRRIPGVMGDFAKGVRAFQDGLKAEPGEERKAPVRDQA